MIIASNSLWDYLKLYQITKTIVHMLLPAGKLDFYTPVSRSPSPWETRNMNRNNHHLTLTEATENPGRQTV